MTHTAYNLSLRARLMVVDEESGGDDQIHHLRSAGSSLPHRFMTDK